jgi:hypothetical protein
VLKIDQNQQRVDDSEQFLAIFNRNKDEFFRRYITMDVTWLLHNTPDSRPSGLNAMNRIQSVEKRSGQLASVIWDVRGIKFIDYLEKCRTINSEYNMALLERLNDEIKKKTVPFEEKQCCFMNCVTNQSKQRQNCMN